MKMEKWNGQLEPISMEYDIQRSTDTSVETRNFLSLTANDEITIDKIDCLVAASSGMLTAMLDVLWVGEFSLPYAQEIGTEQINNIVIAIAQKDAIAKGKTCPKTDLKSCIRFLEKEYPLASDKLTNEFGGGLQHHLRDFSHHASPFGLVCSILNQFTKHGYGTDTDGSFINPAIPETDAIGKSFEEKVTLGIVSWFFHLVSDMAGSSGSVGRGTGIPGPILSLAKVLSATPIIKELKVRYKGDDIGFSVWVSKLFNGTAFAHTNHNDIVRFDLRTEIGIANFAGKQAVPVLLNQCAVRSFYFVRRLAQDFSEKQISSLSDIKRLDAKRFLPFNNRTITHMITISTGVFSVVDGADAIIRAKVNNPNDSVKAVSDALLRLNFVGIGAFAISIKNEIKYAVQDIKGISGKKTKAQQLLEQRDSQCNSVQHIEVDVEMDNRNLYEYVFAELTNMVVLSREKLLKHHTTVEKSIGKIFNFGEGDFGAYKSIVEANESRAIKKIETLVVRMCEQNNIPFEYYPVDAQFSSCYFDTQNKSRPFQIVRTENAMRVGYVFCDHDEISGYVRSFMDGVYKVDFIKIVRVNSPDEDAYKLFYEEPNKHYAEKGIFVRMITLEELFDDFFGKDEYSTFVDYVNKFNIKAKETIGFNTVLAPTESAIERFRIKTGEFLATYPYKELIPPDIYQSQVNVLLNNYLNRGLWRAMVGKSDFAISFISSEWNYSTCQLTENLDMTGIVAGYLKSIEQLLFRIISISEDKGISIKTKDGRIIDFAIENESCIDSTLGSLEAAIQHNGHILDVSPYMKRYLVDTIAEWRNDQRNGHFHKHNLSSIEKVEEIRNKAIYLYFLILGSCTIRDDQFAKLEIAATDESNDFSYDGFVSWLDPILNYGLPKDTVAICLMLYDTEEGLWSLQLHGLCTFDKNVAFYEWRDNFNSGHNAYKWERNLSEKEAVHMVAEAVEEYIKTGTYKDKLVANKAVAVACRFHTEFPYEYK